jgi:hypothetical protein
MQSVRQDDIVEMSSRHVSVDAQQPLTKNSNPDDCKTNLGLVSTRELEQCKDEVKIICFLNHGYLSNFLLSIP